MAVPWGLITFLLGTAYGWLRPGREAKGPLLRAGLLAGVVVAFALLAAGLAVGSSPLGTGLGALDVVVAFLVLSLLFVVGVWIGDVLEAAPRRA